MHYTEIAPPPALQPYVSCFWHLTGQAAPSYSTVFPDGCTDIIFNFADSLLTRSGQGATENPRRAFVVGNMTRPILSQSASVYHILAVRFTPGGMSALVPMPLSEITDLAVDAEDLPVFRGWFDALAALPSLSEQVSWISQRLVDSIRFGLPLSLRRAVVQLHRCHGLYPIANLSADIGISQKQLERQFRHHVGLTPKQLARVVQFQHMMKLLKSRGEESLFQLAIDAGYHDHAHFTKSFRDFAGMTPQQYLVAR